MRKLLAVTVVLLLAGCDTWYTQVPSPDDVMHAIPWFDHMLMSKAIQPYQSAAVPRNTPAGAVPVGGGEADWRVGDPKTLVYFFDTVKANRLVHPKLTPRPDSRGGEQLFNTYCAVCHNYNGDGHGPVSEMLALSLLTAQARGYTDGYLYSMIRYGRLRMPQYGDKITRIDERWALVDYVRQLQAKSPVEPTPGMPAPTRTGH
jgi:mono/diheme cytochrome c family protein